MDFAMQLQVIRPEVWMACLALVVLTAELVFKEKEVLAVLTVASVAIVAVFTLINPPGIAFNNMFISDNFSRFFKIIFYINAILVTFISVRYQKVEE